MQYNILHYATKLIYFTLEYINSTPNAILGGCACVWFHHQQITHPKKIHNIPMKK